MRSPNPAIRTRAGVTPLLLRGLAIVASAAIATSCWADVIEIGATGDAVTYARPAVFTTDGAAPIASEAPRQPFQPVDLTRVIAEAAARSQVSADLITEVAWRESRFHQGAVSNRDAVGVMQLTAGTARSLGVDRFDITQNIHGGAAYLRQMMDRYGGDLRLTLAAYNAGPGAVDRYRGVPPFPETQSYVAAIVGRLSQRAAVSVTPSLVIR